MKKLKTLILLIIITLILSGCTAIDTVTIDENGKIKEKVSVLEDNTKVLYGTKTLTESVEQALSGYKPALDFRKYKTDVKIYEQKSGVVATNEFDDFCAFINNTVFSQYVYKHINCLSSDEYYTVESVGDFITIDSHYVADPVPDVMKLKLKLTFSLTENNADKIKGNTYTWVFDKNTPTNKRIMFKIKKSDFEKAVKEMQEVKKKKEFKKKMIKVTSIIVSLLVFAVLVGAIVLRLYGKMQQNKLDY